LWERWQTMKWQKAYLQPAKGFHLIKKLFLAANTVFLSSVAAKTTYRRRRRRVILSPPIRASYMYLQGQVFPAKHPTWPKLLYCPLRKGFKAICSVIFAMKPMNYCFARHTLYKFVVCCVLQINSSTLCQKFSLTITSSI